MNRKFLSMLGFAALAATISTSCSKDDDNTDTTTIVTTEENAVEKATAAWKTARADWEVSEAFLFGAAGDYEIDPHIDTWPVDQTALAQLLRNETVMNDIENQIANQDDGLLGFHGIEYILFREGSARAAADITNLEYKYAKAVSRDLYRCTCVLEACWAGRTNVPATRQALVDAFFAGRNDQYNDYGTEFVTYGEGLAYETANDAAVQILEGARDIIGEVQTGKIGKPHRGEDANYIESPYAYNSIQDFYDNIKGCKNALYGGLDATSPLDGSIMKFCLSTTNTTLTARANNVIAALDNALAKIQAMKKPFALYYTDPSAGAAMEALGTLDEAIDSMEETLKTYKTNADVEAQLAQVNRNYIRNVVVPTYSALANHAEQMVSTIENIAK